MRQLLSRRFEMCFWTCDRMYLIKIVKRGSWGTSSWVTTQELLMRLMVWITQVTLICGGNYMMYSCLLPSITQRSLQRSKQRTSSNKGRTVVKGFSHRLSHMKVLTLTHLLVRCSLCWAFQRINSYRIHRPMRLKRFVIITCSSIQTRRAETLMIWRLSYLVIRLMLCRSE